MKEYKKAYVLGYVYGDKSGFETVRVYSDEDHDQALSDWEMLDKHASCDREWFLSEVDLYNNKKFIP